MAGLLHRQAPGTWVDVVWEADGAALDLPVELLRLTAASGADLGPLALRGGVTVLRRVPGAAGAEAAVLPGPVKILAAVATPAETLTTNAALDTEAEMQAVLDAVSGVAGDPRAAAGNLNTAQHHFEIDLAIAERLAALDPANAQWQRDLEISRQRIADVVNAPDVTTTVSTDDRKPRTLWAAAAGMTQKLSSWRGKLRRSDRETRNRG